MSRLAAGPSGADESEYDVVQPRPFWRGAASGALLGVPAGLVIIGVVSIVGSIKGKLVGALV